MTSYLIGQMRRNLDSILPEYINLRGTVFAAKKRAASRKEPLTRSFASAAALLQQTAGALRGRQMEHVKPAYEQVKNAVLAIR